MSTPKCEVLEDFLEFLSSIYDPLFLQKQPSESQQSVEIGSIYCSECGDRRRVRICVLYPRDVPKPPTKTALLESLTPSLYRLECLQCSTEFTSLIYRGCNGSSLAVFLNRYGGPRTPHTPKDIAFYLDQAHRAQTAGANSAALAMYRGALEHLLFEHGYRSGVLAGKIEQFMEDIHAIAPVGVSTRD